MLNDPNWLTQIAELHKSPGKSYFGLDAAAIMWWRETSNFLAVKFCRRLRMCLWPFSISSVRHKRINKKGQNYFCDSTCSLHLSKIYTMYIYLFIHFIFWNFWPLSGKRWKPVWIRAWKGMFQLEEDLHLYHGFHSGGNGFLLSMKTAKRNKSIHNFLCYFGIILSNPFFSFLTPSVSNSVMALRKYIKEHSLMCNFFPFCG